MDCGACGKPISLTAKFCGKCGAAVKRAQPTQDPDKATPSLLDAAPTQPMPSIAPANAESQPMVELDLTIETLPASAEHAAMLNIDLDLMGNDIPDINVEGQRLQATAADSPKTSEAESDLANEISKVEAIQLPEPVVASQAQVRTVSADVAQDTALTAQWFKDWNAANVQIQEQLKKHSHLLDEVILHSQQLSQRTTLIEALDSVMRELLDRQNQLSNQLSQVQDQMHKPTEPAVVKMPDEFKLHLEKQKIELLKAFSQNIAQNTSNVDTANQQTLERIETLMAENTSATQTLEVHLAPISQSVADLKARIQAISKKVDDAADKPIKSVRTKNEDSTEGSGGFIIFVIGLLCGLTVVLSSLAIYNFLSHEPSPTAKSSHDTVVPGEDKHGNDAHEQSGHDAPAHGDAAKDASAHEEPAHGGSTSHDKPASDSSSKAKSH